MFSTEGPCRSHVNYKIHLWLFTVNLVLCRKRFISRRTDLLRYSLALNVFRLFLHLLNDVQLWSKLIKYISILLGRYVWKKSSCKPQERGSRYKLRPQSKLLSGVYILPYNITLVLLPDFPLFVYWRLCLAIIVYEDLWICFVTVICFLF